MRRKLLHFSRSKFAASRFDSDFGKGNALGARMFSAFCKRVVARFVSHCVAQLRFDGRAFSLFDLPHTTKTRSMRCIGSKRVQILNRAACFHCSRSKFAASLFDSDFGKGNALRARMFSAFCKRVVARFGLPLIIHLLWIAAMSGGVREEEFIARSNSSVTTPAAVRVVKSNTIAVQF